MKFFHLSDLHLGKTVHDYSMLEDQAYILEQILDLAREHKPDAVLIAGDVYDRSVAPSEAMTLFDHFLVELVKLKIQVFVIAGNHDSPERLAFAARLLSGSGVHIAPVYKGKVHKTSLEDDFGGLDVYLLPFLRPNLVRRFFPESKINTWTEALGAALSGITLDPNRRSILLSHQFVTGGETSESEEFAVGGADNVDASVFDGFDYVALGHLHKAQSFSKGSLRYCGTPLKYSFSEARHVKSLSVVEIKNKGEVAVSTLTITPKRDLLILRGSYLELTSKAFYNTLNREHYYQIVLTDELDQPNAQQKLRLIYPNLMHLTYDNARTRSQGFVSPAGDTRALSPLMLFDKLYEEQNAQPLTPEQRAYLSAKIEGIWEGSV